MMKNYFLSVLCLLSIHLSSGQESDFGNWLVYIGNKTINEKWNWHNEVQYRNYDAIGDLEQLMLRTGIGYNLAPRNNFLMGYAYIRSENYVEGSDDKTSTDEHRIFQQYISKNNTGTIKTQHRYRFEQRFIENQKIKLRFRYFLGFQLPLKKKLLEDKTYYISAYNEVFLNTKGGVFDRHRVYGGIGYKFNASLRLEAGYMHQFFEHGGRDQLNILAFVNF